MQFGLKEGDCSRIAFHKTHIKGAEFLDLDTLKDIKSDLPFMLPSQEKFIERMKELAIKVSDTIVCYDTGAM